MNIKTFQVNIIKILSLSLKFTTAIFFKKLLQLQTYLQWSLKSRLRHFLNLGIIKDNFLKKGGEMEG